jgi:hypothetical protein
MEDMLQPVFAERGKQCVHMIRHDAPGKDFVSLTLKLVDRISDNFGNTRVAPSDGTKDLRSGDKNGRGDLSYKREPAF